MKYLNFFSFIVLLSWSISASSQTDHSHHRNMKPTDEKGSSMLNSESIYHLNSNWTTQFKKVKKLSDFRGKIQILAMIYTQCEYVCPLIVNDIQKIERKIPEGMRKDVQFVLVSFDPENDNPDTLKEYAQIRNLSANTWTLLTGKPGDILELATVLGVKYSKDKKGGFSHSNIISVLDKEGIIRYQQIGLNKAPDAALDIINRYQKN